METPDSTERINAEVVNCTKCPRLVSWRESVASDPPARFRGDAYWARPLPGFGDPSARVLVVGLAPAAHGGNRTGRIFTGDRSGDWLYRALYRAGFANQPESLHPEDGLTLRRCYIAAAVRCAPPGNRPLPEERDNCLPYLVRELRVLEQLAVIVPLGGFAWQATLAALGRIGVVVPSPKPVFGHKATCKVGRYLLIGSYHPSQQNTFTGKLTEKALDEVFATAALAIAERS
ncbi:MAG: uracil-DNA glycosylase [Actinomycetota bacterium]|nr:uracil-DNA glycosylase [Actinomycetota bacterium]